MQYTFGTDLTGKKSAAEAIATIYPHTLIETELMPRINGVVSDTPVQTAKMIFRDDGKEIGAVGQDYTIVQPIELAQQFDPLLETGMIDLEVGGTLKDGRQMWMLGKVKDAEQRIIGNDTVKQYLLMYTGFDGSLRLGGTFTPRRPYCQNTLYATIRGHRRSEPLGFMLKHTRNVHARLNDASNLIRAGIESFQQQIDAFRVMANKKVTRKNQETYVEHTFLEPEEIAGKKEISGKKQTTIRHVIELLDTQRGLDLVPQIKGTAWQAYNAVTEYITHDYGRTEDSRLSAQWFGATKQMNADAFERALAL